MAIALVQSKGVTGTSGSPTVSYTSTGAGNLLVAFLSCGQYSGNPTFTTPTNWTAETEMSQNAFSPQNGQVFYYVNNAGGLTSTTFTASVAPNGWDLYFLEFSGVATSSALDVEGQTVGGSYSSSPSQAITTTANGDLVIGWVNGDAVNGCTSITGPASGWNNLASLNDGNGFERPVLGWQVQASSGLVTYTATVGGGATDWMAAAISFKAASGGGSVNGSSTIFSFAGIWNGFSGQAALPRGINAGPGLGGGINGNSILGRGISAGSSTGGGIAAQSEIQASSAATPTETIEGQAGFNSGLSGQGEVGASSQALDQATIQGEGAVGTGQSGSGSFGRGFSGSGGLSTGLAGFAGFISGLAAQGIIPAVVGTIGGAANAAATILAEAGFLLGFGGHGDVHGSTASLNQATVTGSGNVQPNFLAGIAKVIASSAASVVATILSGAGLGTGQSGHGNTEAASAATPGLTVEGSGALGGGLFAGIADFVGTGGIQRFAPFKIAIASVKGLVNLLFGNKTPLSLAVVDKAHINLSFLLEPPVAKPNSTITVTATATDVNGNPVSNMATVTVTVTFPDGSTQNFSLSGATVTNAGSGNYTITYNTKTPGNCLEDWSMVDPTGNICEYHNITPVGF